MYVYIYIIKSLFSIAKQLLRKGIMSLQNIDMSVHNEFCVCIGMEGTHTYICMYTLPICKSLTTFALVYKYICAYATYKHVVCSKSYISSKPARTVILQKKK